MNFLKSRSKRPAKLLVKLARKKIYQTGARWRRRVEAALSSDCYTDFGSVALAGRCDVHDRGCFYWSNSDREKLVAMTQRQYREDMRETIKSADDICEHVFCILGSARVCLGRKIDWHQDFKSGYRWPVEFYADIAQVQSDKSADVKVPRELSRCHHFVTLGRAYWFTGDERYAHEFVTQLTDWIQNNPARMTVNWCSAMDVAIRAVNWTWAYYFFAHSPYFNEDEKTLFLRSLMTHAQFVSENLEYYGELSDNHYVSNLVGLAVIGMAFPHLKGAAKWRQIGLCGLFEEIENQVHDDGVQFEGAINYHRLVLEMFVVVIVLAVKTGIEVPRLALRRLEKMIEFTLYYLKPDGSAPNIGDVDDARLQVLGSVNGTEHRYLLAVGAVLFGRSDFKTVAGGFPEDAFWLLGREGLDEFDALRGGTPPLQSKPFPESGFYFMRKDRLYMAVRCAANGRRGLGNHSHNDALSFELYAYDKSFIIDPGTYVYTSAPDWRNLFRSTAYHNTLVVDGEEINRIPKDLFRLANDTSPVVNKWEVNHMADFLDAQHNGYERLREPVTHRRQIYFDKIENCWLIRDLVTGRGKHTLSWYFHFDAGIDLAVKDALTVETLCRAGANLTLRAIPAQPIALELDDGWVSPSYGVKKRARVVKYACTVEVPTWIVFLLCPSVDGRSHASIPDRIIAQAEQRWCAAA